MGTYMQVLHWPEYDVELGRDPDLIVDAGANIGLSVLWFADRYPTARIIALEPEPANFALLQVNTSGLDNVTCMRAALWSSNEDVVISDPGRGTWGFQTNGVASGEESVTAPGLTIDHLFERFAIERINLLKVDIEGAEREVFASRPSELGRIDVIAIELHDGLHPGCSEAFFSAIDGELGTRHTSGEHVFAFRDGWAPDSVRSTRS
jgi:FkbM family methyltransferase